jgi:hypothetical protein
VNEVSRKSKAICANPNKFNSFPKPTSIHTDKINVNSKINFTS